MPSGRPTWLKVDLSALRHNYLQARNASAATVETWPVIKADGYGVGAVAVARTLIRAGADGFCVAMVEEAEALRIAGIDAPLVVMSSITAASAERIVAAKAHAFISDIGVAKALAHHGLESHPTPIYLKVNTGMGRLGVEPGEVDDLLKELARYPSLRVMGLVSHLACADQPEHPENGRQIALFQALVGSSTVQQLTAGRHSLANSGGTVKIPTAHHAWTRPGIMLYGASPFFPHSSAHIDGLQEVITWHSHILKQRTVPAGTSLGYGHSQTTACVSRLGVIPVGYADGYRRRLGNGGGAVLIAGQKAPLLGRVCMDMITVDLTHLPHITPDEPVLLLGNAFNIEDWAGTLQTIPYEILCQIGDRVPRVYGDSPSDS
ncbi:MAG: alanine racemase [Magnetococcales bacterium]|nr:alanine racemase [Magnetococcales bacterium]